MNWIKKMKEKNASKQKEPKAILKPQNVSRQGTMLSLEPVAPPEPEREETQSTNVEDVPEPVERVDSTLDEPAAPPIVEKPMLKYSMGIIASYKADHATRWS